jgi:hypothetical protein
MRLWASERRAGARDELTRPARRCTTAKDDSKQGLTPCSCLCRLYAASVSLSFERVVLPADYRLRNGLGAVGAAAAIGLGLPVALPLGALSAVGAWPPALGTPGPPGGRRESVQVNINEHA